MRILITGGAGFIGSNIALSLEQQNNQVTVVDNFSTGSEDNLPQFKGKVLRDDVSEDKFDLTEHYDAIFHFAGITDARYENEQEILQKNIRGFQNIVRLAQKNKAKLVYGSSASLYGNGPTPMQEDQIKYPFSAYAQSKLKIDELAEKLFSKIHIVGLRYFNVFGPRESYKGRAASMIYHLRKQILAGRNPRLFRYGEQKRDHIYIKDAIKASIMALNAPSGIYNVGTGKAIGFNEIVSTLDKVLGTHSKIEYFKNPYQGKYQINTQADTKRAERILGFKAQFDFLAGVLDYHNYLKIHEK